MNEYAIRLRLEQFSSPREKKEELLKLRKEVLQALATGTHVEPMLVQYTDTGKFGTQPATRSLFPNEIEQLKRILEWTESELRTVEWRIANETSLDIQRQRAKYRVPVSELVKKECERLELVKKCTVSRETKYEIAIAVGIIVPPFEQFRTKEQAYHKISKYLSELGYSGKRTVSLE